jgi:hypothetical protein
MRNKISAVLLAGLCASLPLTALAQSQPGAPAKPSTQAMQAADVMTITGCLKNEKDVPGLKPSVVERAGITEDYILTEVKPSTGSKTSAIGLGTMYEIEGIAENDLKSHLNQQIEVTGKLATTATGTAAKGTANRDDVPDFNATSIRMLSATCPAK